jgi:hypothetical protein
MTEAIRWQSPSVLWAEHGGAREQPELVRFASDNFLPEFLEQLAGRNPNRPPSDLDPPERTNQLVKLFQPLHGRFYLVTGSLVCRRIGLPDHTVARQAGERTTFVIRRRHGVARQEQGWVNDGPGRGWHDARPDSLVDGEEQLPLHSAPTSIPDPFPAVRRRENGHRVGLAGPGNGAARVLNGAVAAGSGARIVFPIGTLPRPAPSQDRAVHYGYVPVDSREKYLVPLADPVAALWSFPAPEAGSKLTPEPDARLSELEARVLRTWRGMYVEPIAYGPLAPAEANLLPELVRDISLFLLLDLAENLRATLPDVFRAATTAGGSVSGAAKTVLLNLLRDVTVTSGAGTVTLAEAISELEPFIPLLRGQPPTGASTTPPRQYDARAAFRQDPANPGGPRLSLGADGASFLRPNGGVADRLYSRIGAAIAEGAAPVRLPPELDGMIKADPPDAASDGDRYVIRLVFEYPPCCPVISEPTEPFVFARALDPDAPARKVRVEVPSFRDLRKFKRGVALEMPPDVRSLMDRVNKKMLDGEGLLPGPDWQLGMICSFSIQIIFLVAFIVMFIFLIALNFIFWWLPFLKICFPIPVRK